MTKSRLWYDKPATDWLNGLPIGTGRLAAMVLGGLKSYSYRSMFMPARREYLAHLSEDMILARFSNTGRNVSLPTENNTALFDCSLWLDRIVDPGCRLTFETKGDELRMHGAFEGGIDFIVSARIYHDGDSRVNPRHKLAIRGATEVLVAIDIGTGAHPDGAEGELALRRLSSTRWGDLVAAHVAEHRRQFGAFALSLPSDVPELPTDERVRRVHEGASDPGLLRLYLDFGRYLLMASSATGQLPANLQGKWNEDVEPPWQSDYHFDINLQMCYWMAEPVGMAGAVEALLTFFERFVPHARKAAMDTYGCRGILFPIQTDCWGRSTPEAYGWAVWVGAAPWAAQHVWWHYEYSQDKVFLNDRGYPFLREVVQFFEDYCLRAADGSIQIVPSQSPENRFVGSGELPVSLCVNAAMDLQLLRDVLDHAIDAATILGVDADDRARWKAMRAALPPTRIGSDGRLLEWSMEVAETEPGHRHLSHLFGLFPGDEFDADRTPELYAAAVKSLDFRVEHFNGLSGWSLTWVGCLCARLGRGDEAFKHLTALMTENTSDKPIGQQSPRIYQIDTNLGGVAVMTEMLVQSRYGELRLLPALPSAWPEGSVRGLRARGGFTVDVKWSGGQLHAARISSVSDRDCVLVGVPDVCIRDGDQSVAAGCGRVVFAARAGHSYDLVREMDG